MRRRTVRGVVWVAAFPLLAPCPTPPTFAADPPVRADFLGTRDGKPPLRSHAVRLQLVNRSDEPVWFVLPYWGDRPLPDDGVFPNKDGKGQPFGGLRFDGDGGSAVQVEMYGGAGFKAFRLPGRGQLDLARYPIDAFKDVGEVGVLEARELKVNGTTPLEKWLPYGTASGAKVRVGERALGTDWTNLDWDRRNSRPRDDYPKERVAEVRAEGRQAWVVKFQRTAK